MKRINFDGLRFHTVELHIEGNSTVLDPTMRHYFGMKGYFSPSGIPCHPSTHTQLHQALYSVALIVQILHGLGIFHNDIRGDNICAVEVPESGKPVRILLFNFDDAYVLNVNNQCPGLPYLSSKEHPWNSEVQHGGEVGIWAIGMLISQHFLNGQLPALQQFGQKIQTNFETIL